MNQAHLLRVYKTLLFCDPNLQIACSYLLQVARLALFKPLVDEIPKTNQEIYMNLHHSLFKYFIATSISVLLLSTAAHAMQPRGGGFIGMNQGNNSFGSLGDVDRTARQFRLLDLSDDQRQQLWAIADSYRTELREQQDALSDGHGAIQALLISESYDPVQLSALADNQGNIVARMIEQHAEMVRQMGTVLTAEQVALFVEQVQSRSTNRSQNGRFGRSNTIDSIAQ